MSTAAVYTLFDMAERSGTEESWSAPTGQRTGWTAELQVGALESGGSVTVALESSPNGLEGSWDELTEFGGAKSSEGETEESTGDGDFSVSVRERYLRGRIKDHTGKFTIQLLAWAPFLDPTDSTDKNLLSQELRQWSDGLTRTVEKAERDVLSLLKLDPVTGELDLALNLHDAHGEIRQMIAEQAEWLFHLHELRGRAKSEPSALVSLREAPDTAPGIMDRVDDLVPVSHRAWRGR